MTDVSAQTESLCPHCLRLIPAQRIFENNEVYLQKNCPEHGAIGKVLLWSSSSISFAAWNRHRLQETDPHPLDLSPQTAASPKGTAAHVNCPFQCGICSHHRQSTCSTILEVSSQCNLHCPVCFAASPATNRQNPTLTQIERMLQKTLESAGPCPIQLSGGEPTLRDDLPQIVALARSLGFDHVQINTNGIRMAQDPEYVRALKESGVTDFFLQFDGVTDEVYSHIRGMALLSLKQKAIEICAKLKIAVILVPTLVKGVNDSQIGAIIQFAKKWMPTVKGVHFQPMTYLGRYPNSPCNENRFLIPDILTAIEQQTEGELKVDNFIPPG
jgi:uncharacterized radical SAM superfamily Fe-S cluster-containing enzyme